ncbi:MAG: branched-chain-amino-acid transaminase [Phycisphaeraceae bacterium]|nr:branched-chain-amino-acid transaminase [Phycisphaeraceae bacterium]
MPKSIWLNGNLVPPEQATVSVFDHGLLYGDGVFEGIRVYNRRVFKLRTHLQRLFKSARSIRLTPPLDLGALDAATRETVAANDCVDGYIRLCITRGSGTLGLHPFKCRAGAVFIIADTIALYPPELYENGLEVITSSVTRNHPAAVSPQIKSLNYLNNILAKIEAIDAGKLEAVMLNHQGYVAECTGDNIFVVRDAPGGGQELVTPPVHAGILEGITMNTVIGLAVDAGITVNRANLTRHDLYVADEMFLTGTAAEVIPVTEVDGRAIGAGRPGPVTRRLIDAFHALVSENAPED